MGIKFDESAIIIEQEKFRTQQKMVELQQITDILGI